MTTGTILAYLLHSALFLSLGYVAYRLCLAKVKMPAFNRAVILIIYAVAFFAPAMLPDYGVNNIEATEQTEVMAPISAADLSAEYILENALPKEYPADHVIESQTEESSSAAMLLRVVCALAMAGAGLLILQIIFALGTIMRFSRKGEHIKYGSTHLVLLNDQNISPFSLLNLIFMSRSDFKAENRMILEHELSHIRHLHFIDLIVAKLTLIAMWWNPLSWLMFRELRAVHEYQADATVLHSGHEIKDYQFLLIKKAAGARLPSVASSLNHSKLKKRFAMMYQKSPSRWAALRAAALIPAFCGALLLTGQASFASMMSELSEIRLIDNAETEILESDSRTDDDKITQNEYIPQVLSNVSQITLTAGTEEETEDDAAPEILSEGNTEETLPIEPTDVTGSTDRINETVTDAYSDTESDSFASTDNSVESYDDEAVIIDSDGNVTRRKLTEQELKEIEKVQAQAKKTAAEAREYAEKTRENAAKARENAAQVRKNAAIARENAAKARENAAQARKNAAIARENAAKARENAAQARKNAAKARKNGMIILNESNSDRLTPEQIKQLEEAGVSFEHVSAELEATAQSLEGMGQQLNSIDWDSLNKLNELKNLDQLDLSALNQLATLEDSLSYFKSKEWADAKNKLNNLRNTSANSQKAGKSGKLTCEVLSVSNANGTTITVMVTSPSTIVVKNAKARIDGKSYTCKVAKNSTRYNNGRYQTAITLKIGKSIKQFKNHEDFVTLTTSAGTVKANISYF